MIKKPSPVMLAALVSMFAQAASAQATATAPASASAAPANGTPVSDRVKRDADKVFQMILMHADKKPIAKVTGREGAGAAPAPVAAAQAPAPAAAAPVTAAARPAPSPAASKSAAATSSEAVRTATTVAAATQAAALPQSSLSPGLAPSSSGLSQPAPNAPAAALPAQPAPSAKPEPLGAALPQPAAAPQAATNSLELVSSVEPDFPPRLLRTLGSGKVLVQFTVNASGVVTEAQAVESSHKGLDAAAIAAVKQWRFKPMAGSANGMTELRFE